MKNESNNSLMPGVLLLLAILIIGVGGYFLYTKVIAKDDNAEELAEDVDNVIDDIADGITDDVEDGSEEANPNIFEIAQEESNLSTLVKAIVAADLDAELSFDTQSFTVFAPTDDAFEALGEDEIDRLLLPENGLELRQLLEMHIVNEELTSNDLLLLDGTELTTMGGDKLMVRVLEGRIYVNDALIETVDVLASNGVIHLVDSVITVNVEDV